MTTPTDTDDPPPPDSRSALLANKPERCNTKIIDPALLADIVPQAPPESRRPGSESASTAAQERPRTAFERAPEAAPAVATKSPDEAPPSPTPPTAKTMVVAYAPTPAPNPRRTVRLVALLVAGLALGVAAWFGLEPPAPQAPGAAPAQPEEKVTPLGPPAADPFAFRARCVWGSLERAAGIDAGNAPHGPPGHHDDFQSCAGCPEHDDDGVPE